MFVNKIYYLIIISLICSSCSISSDVVSDKRIQKRKYNKGIHTKKSNKNHSLSKTKKSYILRKNVSQFSFEDVVKPSINEDVKIDIIASKNSTNMYSFKDSQVIFSKNTINQKLFLDDSKPKIEVKNKIKNDYLNPISNETYEESKIDPVSLISLWSGLLSIVSLFFAASYLYGGISFVFASFIFGALSLGFGIAGTVRKISKSETHKGFGMAVAGICFGAIFGGISAIILTIWSLFQ